MDRAASTYGCPTVGQFSKINNVGNTDLRPVFYTLRITHYLLSPFLGQ